MTTIGYGPLERIDGPPPLAPLYGLLAAAQAPAAGVRLVVDTYDGQVVDLSAGNGPSMEEVLAELRAAGSIPANAGQERWLNGVEVFPYPPDAGSIHDACATGTSAVKGDGEEVTNPQFGAITAYVAETCRSYKIWDQAAFRARAVAALSAVESSIVARHFLTGEGLSTPNPHLADGNADILNGGHVTNAMNGLALLEQAIAETGRQGIIHCSPQFAEGAAFGRLSLDNRTGVIRTINGTVVIPDYGYAVSATPTGGSSPAGTQEWIYATGPVDIRRSEVFVLPENVSEALDRTNNAVTYRAERYYLIDWDTELQAAVLADRCQAGC